MTQNNFIVLLDKFLLETLSAEEWSLFAEQCRKQENQPLLQEIVLKKLEDRTYQGLSDKNRIEEAFRQVMQKGEEQEGRQLPETIQINGKPGFFTFRRVAAAAAIIVFLAAGADLFFSNNSNRQAISENQPTKPIRDIAPPVSANAVLTLADGSRIVLDSAGNGSLATQGAASIIKLADGRIAYTANANSVSEVQYNTLTVPRGSKVMSLVLADGSKVWMNAESSLRYPTAFVGSERKVEITGEAYFEVAKNAAMPFVVKKGDMAVQVLGTHFNVNTYEDEEQMKITLLEGSVNVSQGNNKSLLKPGQQARIQNGIMNVTNQVDIEEVMAWKNGLFNFKGDNINTVMRQLARWYDLDVYYEKQVTEKFYVKMNRNTNVSNVFKILETTGGVHFKIEGKKIMVMP